MYIYNKFIYIYITYIIRHGRCGRVWAIAPRAHPSSGAASWCSAIASKPHPSACAATWMVAATCTVAAIARTHIRSNAELVALPALSCPTAWRGHLMVSLVLWNLIFVWQTMLPKEKTHVSRNLSKIKHCFSKSKTKLTRQNTHLEYYIWSIYYMAVSHSGT